MVELIHVQLPQGFLDEKNEYGFHVTKLRKELWAIEIDLLLELKRVCDLLNLKWCVGAGTLLGAVRHHGFIPWDDDIDVYLLRKDYDLLMQNSEEFKDPFFLQNSFTDYELLRTHAQLRRNGTTGCSQRDAEKNIHKGIFIDIFPLDGLAPNKLGDFVQSEIELNFRRIFDCYDYVNRNKKENYMDAGIKLRIKRLIVKALIRDKKQFFQLYEDNLRRYSVTKTKIWENHALASERFHTRRPIEDYQDLISIPFEFIQVLVPRNYDLMLQQHYGDYMKIPVNKKGSVHSELIVSTELDFDNLLHQQHGVLPRLK